MKLLTKTYTCPFCFDQKTLSQIKFRCKNNPSVCPPEEDEVLAKFLGSARKMMGRVFEPQTPTGALARMRAVPKEAVCPKCSEVSRTRICAQCHSELPYTIGDFKDLIMGVIGAKEAGKSHYIAVLINSIRNEVGSVFSANLQALNDETMHRYRNDFYNPIFREKKTIMVTRSARADSSVRVPLIYTLAFSKKGLFGRRKIRDLATISFFDTAGEDLNSEDIMRTESKYIYNSSGIIMLLDPLQLPHVRDALKGKIDLPSENTEIQDILDRTANLIRTAKKLRQDQMIDIPIAVAFSKCDAVTDLLPENSALTYSAKHNGFFDKGDFEAVSSEMEALVAHWSGDFLINQLQNNFRHHAFFGLTALGCNPHGSNKISRVRPNRVADPFLWLLSHHKMIPTKERGT